MEKDDHAPLSVGIFTKSFKLIPIVPQSRNVDTLRSKKSKQQ